MKCHTSQYSLAYLTKNVPKPLQPEMWLPSSPDLNLLDYGIWSGLEDQVWQRKIQIEHLKQRIVQCCDDSPQELIDKAHMEHII